MRRLFLIAAIASLAAIGCKKEKASDSTDTAKVTDNAKDAPPQKGDVVTVTSSSRDAIAAFEEGRALQENFRFADATKKYERALELDPSFALVHAYLGEITTGDEAEAHGKKAGELAEKLPENERLYIGTMVGAVADRITSLEQLGEKVPGDWRVQMMIARRAQKKGDDVAARVAFETASKLNPEAPYPYNNLAYLYAFEGDYDKAIAAVTRYAELSPGEPNPLDSKGEILLMAGKFPESEAAFAEAVKLSPSFAIAHEGIAATRFYRDDWKGGVAELEIAARTAVRPIERFELTSKLAWAYIASDSDDKATAAFAAAREAAAEAGMSKTGGNALLVKAEIHLERKEWEAAASLAGEAVKAMHEDGIAAKKQRWAQTVHAIAFARGGKVEAADKTLASLAEGEADDHYVHYARGHIELAKGDDQAALAALDALAKDKWFANRAALLTAEVHAKAGRADEARKIRDKLSTEYRRDIYSVMIREDAMKAGNI